MRVHLFQTDNLSVPQMPASCVDMDKYAHNYDANLGVFGKSTETHSF